MLPAAPTPIGGNQTQTVQAPIRPLDFTEDVERQALRLVCTDPNFAPKWHGTIKPEHWNHPWNGMIYRAVSGYFQKYAKLPSTDAVIQVLKSTAHADDPLPDIAQHLTNLVQTPVVDDMLIKDLLMEHGRHTDYEQFVLDSTVAISERNYDEIPEKIRDLMGRHKLTKIEPEYMDIDPVERVQAELSELTIMPTRFPTLNTNHGGGYESSSLIIVMGPSGSGKSIQLCNDGAHFLKEGKNVYHFTFELSREKTMARYDVVLTGMNQEHRTKNPEELSRQLRSLRSDPHKPMGKLYMIEHPTGSCTMDMVEQTIQEYILFGAPEPDVIILDYLTIMQPNDATQVDMKDDYSKYKVLAEEARAMAMRWKIPVVTAAQTNRGSLDKDTIRNQDVAGSYALIHIADLVLTINQNENDKQNGKMRLYVSKSRNHPDCYNIVTNMNYKNLQNTESVEETANYNRVALDTQPLTKQQVLGQKDTDSQQGLNAQAQAFDPATADASVVNMLSNLGKTNTKTPVVPLSTPDLIGEAGLPVTPTSVG